MSYEEEDTCMVYVFGKIHSCMSYEEEDTCMSYEVDAECDSAMPA